MTRRSFAAARIPWIVVVLVSATEYRGCGSKREAATKATETASLQGLARVHRRVHRQRKRSQILERKPLHWKTTLTTLPNVVPTFRPSQNIVSLPKHGGRGESRLDRDLEQTPCELFVSMVNHSSQAENPRKEQPTEQHEPVDLRFPPYARVERLVGFGNV